MSDDETARTVNVWWKWAALGAMSLVIQRGCEIEKLKRERDAARSVATSRSGWLRPQSSSAPSQIPAQPSTSIREEL